MHELKDRLKKLRHQKGVSQMTLAKEIGISYQTLGNYETGYIKPSYEVLKKLANYFNVSIDFLLSGADNNVKFYNFDKDVVKINVYGDIPAGIPMEMIDDVIGEEEIPKTWLRGGSGFFGIRLTGDSMYPEFKSGDIIIAKQQQVCENGELCVVSINGTETTFKKVIKGEHNITLKPLNDAFEPIIFTAEEVENLPVTILGVFYELRRHVKRI